MQLFRRLNRAIVLTDVGQECLPELRQGFDKLTAAVERLRSHNERDFLVANIAPTFATLWLVPRLLKFQNLHPDITVRMETTTSVVNLVRDGVDVAIRFGGRVGPGLRDEVLFIEEIVPACAPSLLAERPLEDPGDLVDHTLIHIEGESADPSWPDWAAWRGCGCKQRRSKPRTSIQPDNQRGTGGKRRSRCGAYWTNVSPG